MQFGYAAARLSELFDARDAAGIEQPLDCAPFFCLSADCDIGNLGQHAGANG
jgi:hypothetical protein